MKPVIEDLNSNALQPYVREQISDSEFLSRVSSSMKSFMIKQTRKDTLEVFFEVAKLTKDERERIKKPQDIPCPYSFQPSW